MTEPKRPHLPIGYWIKKADEVLTTRIDEAQKAHGLNRTEWQILNLLRESSAATREQIAEVLRPFVDAESIAATLTSLVERGLVEADGGEIEHLRLTELGESIHAVALETQKGIRQRSMQGIDEAEYVTTVRVLQQLVKNLTEAEEASTH